MSSVSGGGSRPSGQPQVYLVRWTGSVTLRVAPHDLPAVIRAVVRSYPKYKITIEPV